jgi:hypothetical protein
MRIAYLEDEYTGILFQRFPQTIHVVAANELLEGLLQPRVYKGVEDSGV